VKVKQSGMTLTEVLIVMAIVGILVSVAFPSYQRHMIETRKADGISIINKIMQAQESFYINNLTYTADLTQLGFANANNHPSEKGYYTATAVACDGGIAVCVDITTTAQGVQVTGTPADDNLSLNSQGAKTGKWPNDH
jgi:type IV pilus assembly protein PilE